MTTKHRFQFWNENTDILVTSATPLLQPKHPVVLDNSPWAYSLNTATGFYHKSKNYSFSNSEHLILTTENGSEKLFQNVTVWPHKYFSSFMLVTLHETKQTILIDSRGIPFEINIEYTDYCYNKNITDDKYNGCFIIDNTFNVKYRNNFEQKQFEIKSSAIVGTTFNKDFNKFIRENSKNTKPYLYLTGGNTKCGTFIEYFSTQGMQYEIVPNMLCDDKSINVRIPLFGPNLLRKDVQFLFTKYQNNYSIYNVPISVAGGVFSPYSKFRTFIPKGKECLAYSIYNTFCSIFSTNDKNKIFQKTIAKILRLFNKSTCHHIPNQFNDLLLSHPMDVRFNSSYFEKVKPTISELLSIDISLVLPHIYHQAYKLSKQQYKDTVSKYESETLQNIVSSGKKISRWKNESHLFAIVSKEYPDAIYQYHCPWLGRQSLDIFIPSLSIGIEYQGEQHYHPIDFFGGKQAFEETLKRDQQKLQLCKDNGITLLHWKYDEIISSNRLSKRIVDSVGKRNP